MGTITSEGELSGEFEAESVRLSGSIKDNTIIRAKTLEVSLVSEGGMQVVFGECELNVGDAPEDGRNNKKKKKGEAEAGQEG
ncbi:hypothetical protein D3C83_180110 [compost metagenome]